MKKLIKYLKPFTAVLVLVFILLFGQAMSDLNLPNYMSRIVNVGIQQNGIENAAPSVISQDGMALMKTFMTDDEKKVVDANYSMETGAAKDQNGKTLKSTFPKIKDQKVYARDPNISKTNLDKLNNVFGNTTWTFINVMQDFSKQQAQNGSSQSGEKEKTNDIKALDLPKLYSMQSAFNQIPEQSIQDAHEKALKMDQSIRNQSGTTFAGNFYEELGASLSSMQTAYIVKIGLLMLLIALLGGIATVLVGLFAARVAAGVARNLRKDIFAKVTSFSNNELEKFSTASLITRSTNDITQIQTFLTIGIRMICYAPIMAVGGTIMAVGKSPSMSWIIAVACILLMGMISIVFAIALPKFKMIQKLVDKLNLVARETLTGLMVIRAFGTANHEKKRFEKANEDLTKTNLFVNRIMVFMMPAMMFIMNGVTLLVVWVGAHQIADSAMQVGDMMAFMQYAMQIIMSFLMVSMMFIFAPRAAVAANRIAEVVETELTIVDPENPKKFSGKNKGLVEFKHVNFRYHDADEDALTDINFKAKPGETTAIIGSTGSGKSTVVNLILRFFDVSQGEILVDGVNVKDVTQKDLRDHIGYVPQKGVLLSGSIKSNLAYGNDQASMETLEKAARIAQAEEFIESKPEGFDSEIAQGGANVSGGQKQRLSIARALAKNPDIYIFDDSFSALDYKTDVALRKALKEDTEDSTVIIVAQRVNTIRHAEQIIVMNQGKIVGIGTHETLLKACPEYYEIASSQLSKEELL